MFLERVCVLTERVCSYRECVYLEHVHAARMRARS
jgi:hypothetical protein